MTLNPAAQALYDYMSDISEEVYAAGWMHDCEWNLWRALTDWQAGESAVWSFADVTTHMPKLLDLHRQAGGWIWWLTLRGDRGGPRFVPDERWLRLVAERERRNGWVSTEDLDAQISESEAGR